MERWRWGNFCETWTKTHKIDQSRQHCPPNPWKPIRGYSVVVVGAKDSTGESHMWAPSYSSKPCVVGRFVFYEERKGTNRTIHVPNNYRRTHYFSVFTFKHLFSFTISIKPFPPGVKRIRLATCNEWAFVKTIQKEWICLLFAARGISNLHTLVLNSTNASIIVGLYKFFFGQFKLYN